MTAPTSPGPMPARARWSHWRQTVILSVRYLFRVPIDTIKENRLAEDKRMLFENQTELERRIAAQKVTVEQLVDRLKFYEAKIPRMRELSHVYDSELKERERRMKAKAKDKKSRLDDGILTADDEPGVT